MTVFRVPLLLRRQGKAWQLVLNYLSFVFFSCLVGPLLCREKYDLIFVFEPSPFTVGIPGTLFRRLKKAPMLFWVQDLWPESIVATGAVRSPFLLSLVGRMVRFIYKRCDRVLIQSQGFEQPVIEAGADPTKILYFPNWAEDLYRSIPRDDSRSGAMKLPEGFRIMFAGNLGAAQALDVIVSAADKLRQNTDLRWIIIGDGRNKDWLIQKIEEYQLEKAIHMIGQQPVENMPVYFSLADVLLVTLRKDMIFELTIPSKIQSYLASGKPVIGALDGEGARIIKASGAGYAVPAEDANALAEAVIRMYNKTYSERTEMGNKGKQYYEAHFSRELLLDKLERIMAETLEEKACAS